MFLCMTELPLLLELKNQSPVIHLLETCCDRRISPLLHIHWKLELESRRKKVSHLRHKVRRGQWTECEIRESIDVLEIVWCEAYNY
jgi:hypothetical protein